MPLVCAIAHDFPDLLNRKTKLFVAVVVVRTEPQPGVRPEVAEDLTLGELLVDGFELGRPDGDGAAPALRVARAADVEARRVEEVDQQLCLLNRLRANPLDADLLDQVVSGRRRVQRRDVRRAGEEARRALRILELRLEAE